MKGKLGFGGKLSAKVIRANPSRKTRLVDFINHVLGRYTT